MRALIAAFLVSWFLAAPAVAQGVQCAPADPAAAVLRADGYELEITGRDAAGTIMEIWTKPDGSWTLLVRPSDAPNVRCGIAAGSAFSTIPTGSRTQGNIPTPAAPAAPAPEPQAPPMPRAEPI